MSFDHTEQMLRQQLADIEMHHRRMAQPVLDNLGKLEAMKPPRPMYIDISQVDPALLRDLGQFPPSPNSKTESYPDRLARMEREHHNLQHLLRLVLAGSVMPDFLRQQIDETLKDMKP